MLCQELRRLDALLVVLWIKYKMIVFGAFGYKGYSRGKLPSHLYIPVTLNSWKMLEYTYVIVVPWVSRVYGICTLRAVICIPEGAARGNTYNCTKSTNPYTLETHGTGDLYHNTITNAVSYDKR